MPFENLTRYQIELIIAALDSYKHGQSPDDLIIDALIQEFAIRLIDL